MAKQLSITLDDKQQAVLEEITRLHSQVLKSDAPTERRVIASAIATGLSRDLATLRRVVGLSERYAK